MSGIRTDRTPAGPGSWRLTWTPTFVAFLAYTFIILTYRLRGAGLVMAGAVLGLFLQRGALRTPRFLWLLAAWIAWAALGYAVTLYPDQVWPNLIEHGKVFLIALVAVNALRTPTQVRYFTVFVLASYVLFPIRSTLINYATGWTVFGRAVGPFIYENPNDLAAHTVLVLGPALASWAGEPRRSLLHWIGLASTAVLLFTILLTQSRAAFLALVVIALPSGIALMRRRPRVVPIVAALVGVALYLAPAGFWERVGGLRKATSAETIGEMDPEGSARERLAVLQTAARIVVDHPLLGVGFGAYAQANARYNPAVGLKDTHNTYLNIAAETGLPGLVLFLALVTSVLRAARDARRRAEHAWPAQAEALRWLQYGLIGYLIAGLFGSFSKLTYPYVFLALVWSASQALRAQWLSTPEPPPIQPDRTPIPVDRVRAMRA